MVTGATLGPRMDIGRARHQNRYRQHRHDERDRSRGEGISPPHRTQLVELLAGELQKGDERSNRRQFIKETGLKLAGLATASTLRTSVGTASAPSPLVPRDLRTNELLDDLVYDLGVGFVQSLDLALYRGEASFVKEQATYRYRYMRDSPYLDDREVALTAIRIGIRLAQAQEATLDWFARSRVAIAIYNDVEERIVKRAVQRHRRDRDILNEYARLLSLRAPLFRELGDYDRSLAEAQSGIRLAEAVGSIVLLVDLHSNVAHVWAVRGVERLWEENLTVSGAVIERAGGRERDGLRSMLTYFKGSGTRRLAFNPHVDTAEAKRIEQATVAIDCLEASRRQLEGQWTEYVVRAGISGHPLCPAGAVG